MGFDHQLAAGHPLAHVVVGIPREDHLKAAGVPDAEALACGAVEVNPHRIGRHALVAVALDDFAGQTRTHRAVGVADVVAKLAAAHVFHRLQQIFHHLEVQRPLVEGGVVLLAEQAGACRCDRAGQNAGEIQLGLTGGEAGQRFQQVGATDEVGQLGDAQLGHQLAGLLGDELEVVHHHLRQAGEVLATQLLILGSDAGGAVVQVADTQVFAAERHHGAGAKTEALGAENGCLDDVQTRFEATVHLQPHLVTQAVGDQRLLGLGQPQLPGGAGVFDRGEGARAGAAVVAGDGDEVRIGLGHAAGDGANAGLGHQFHRHQAAWVDLLDVEDELGQILDGVDVVVGRRRDQGHAGHRVTQLGDLGRHLVTGQLAPFAGLGPLSHLDLHHVGVHQVVGGDAKAPRCHLLDARILLGAEALGILAAFTRVALAAEPVHGHRQRLVGFRAQRADGHGGGVEAGEQLGSRLHLLQRHRIVDLLQGEQIAQGGDRALVHQAGVLLVIGIVAGAHRHLQGLHHVRVVGVVLTTVDEFEQPALSEGLAGQPGLTGQIELILLDVGKIGALDAARYAAKTHLDHRLGEAHRFKQLGAAVAGHRADAHLGHHLVEPLVDAVAVVEHGLAQAHLEHALFYLLGERLVGEVGVDGGGAKAQQHREVVRVTHAGGLHQDVGVAAQVVVHQGTLHRPHRHGGRDGQGVGTDVPIREDQQHGTGLGGSLGLFTDAQDGRFQALFGLEVEADHLMAIVLPFQCQQLVEVGVEQDRRLEQHPVGVAEGLVEHVLLAADTGGQRHDVVFPQRIDGRVGDLGEHLAEVVIQSALAGGEHRHRGVIPHGAHRFLAVFTQYPDDLIQLLIGVAEQLLIGFQLIVGELAGAGAGVIHLLERHQPLAVLVHPLLVGVTALEIVIDLEASPDLAVAGIHHEQLARADPALLQHFVRGVVPGADLGREGDELVLGDDVAGRTQAVSVERAGGVATVGHDDAGRAIPGLHVHGVEVIEGAQVVIHVRVFLPRRRDQQAHGTEQVHAASQEQIQHVVEAGGIRPRGVDEGGGLLQIGDQRRRKLVAASLGPLAVAGDGVDLAVVGQIAERLRQRPARAGVGGETLVEHADGRLHANVGQIQIEARQIHRHAQSFIDGDQVGEADHVEVVVADAFLDAAAHDIEAALEILVDPAGRGVDKDLFDAG